MVNGPSYRFWKLPLAVMANLHRLGSQLVSKRISSSSSVTEFVYLQHDPSK